jgi:hypothetical protein
MLLTYFQNDFEMAPVAPILLLLLLLLLMLFAIGPGAGRMAADLTSACLTIKR